MGPFTHDPPFNPITIAVKILQSSFVMFVGNDLFESFLDPSMSYSCGYWKTAKNLAEAQTDKMELIAKKLMLKPKMRVLDIGEIYTSMNVHT